MKFDELLKDLDIQEFIKSLQNPKVIEFLKSLIDSQLATSDLKVLKRLSAIEEMLGIDPDIEENDDEQVTLIERMDTLEEKVDNIMASAPQETLLTTLEQKAVELVEYLKYDVPERNGSIFLTAREVVNFLKLEVQEHLRMGDIRNPRQAKKDVIEKARKMFPNIIKLDRSKNRNHEVRIVFQPPSVCMDSIRTYATEISPCII